jgi:hypothetical protein
MYCWGRWMDRLKLIKVWTILCRKEFKFLSCTVSAVYKSINFLIKLEPKGKFNQEMKFKWTLYTSWLFFGIVISMMWIMISKYACLILTKVKLNMYNRVLRDFCIHFRCPKRISRMKGEVKHSTYACWFCMIGEVWRNYTILIGEVNDDSKRKNIITRGILFSLNNGPIEGISGHWSNEEWLNVTHV